MKMTVKEFAEKFDVSYVQASGTIGFLITIGVVEKTEEVQQPNVVIRGKRAAVYEFPAAKTIIFDEKEFEELKRKKGKK